MDPPSSQSLRSKLLLLAGMRSAEVSSGRMFDPYKLWELRSCKLTFDVKKSPVKSDNRTQSFKHISNLLQVSQYTLRAYIVMVVTKNLGIQDVFWQKVMFHLWLKNPLEVFQHFKYLVF